MTIPKTLKIGGHVFDIVLKDFDDECDCGEVSYIEKKIYINKKLPESLLASTLIHEAMHVMNTTLDHSLLDSLAEQVYQVLRDNDLLK